MKPTYAENIIVAIKDNAHIEWYIIDKDFCFLDYSKLEKAYLDKGYNIIIDDTARFGIKIVDEFTKQKFLDKIKNCKVTTIELKEILISEESYDEKLAYNYSILIDFYSKMFISNYAELESFENFVPNGWQGKYENFEEHIPYNMKYWIDEQGKNLIRENSYENKRN